MVIFCKNVNNFGTMANILKYNLLTRQSELISHSKKLIL